METPFEAVELSSLANLAAKANNRLCTEVGAFLSVKDAKYHSALKLAAYFENKGMRGVVYHTRVDDERAAVEELLKKANKFLPNYKKSFTLAMFNASPGFAYVVHCYNRDEFPEYYVKAAAAAKPEPTPPKPPGRTPAEQPSSDDEPPASGNKRAAEPPASGTKRAAETPASGTKHTAEAPASETTKKQKGDLHYLTTLTARLLDSAIRSEVQAAISKGEAALKRLDGAAQALPAMLCDQIGAELAKQMAAQAAQ